ncbi:MAG: DUF6033 family protein [Candidatus Gastranaerophilales bacterium]|nr:DUF6033 family protein [Candidatus Gastranaerophilales bacterium]
MAVNINQDYSVFQKSYYGKTSQAKSGSDVKKADKTDSADQTSKTVQLSQKAKALLEEMKKKYSNVDFMVADYETDEEAQDILSRGTKEYSALFDPETLEEMAADDKVKEEYLGKLDGALNQLGDMFEKLGDKADEVKHVGMTFDNDGNVSFFAELEKSSEKQRERIEQARADKKEQAAKDKKVEAKEEAEERLGLAAQGTVKRTRVEAGSAEELLEKINSVNWDSIKATGAQTAGGRFDLTV